MTYATTPTASSATGVEKGGPGSSNVALAGRAISATNAKPDAISSGIPSFISAEEAYFWSFAWQEGIREAMTARASGESRVFDSDDPNDVVKWLLSDHDS